MLYAMGPAQNHEADEAVENTSSDPMSQRGNHSGCNSPEVDRKCRQSPHSSYSHRDQESDAWMGYSGVWSQSHGLYTSQRSQSHHLNMQQQQQPQPQPRRQLSSTGSSWEDKAISSTVESSTMYKKEKLCQEAPEEYAQPSSTNQCDPATHHQSKPRLLIPSQPTTGLVDLRNLTTPVEMISGSDCIPLSEKCMRYSLSSAPPSCPRQATGRSSFLKRKPSLGNSVESTSSSVHAQSDEARAEKRRRFTRTTEALQKLGLWDVAIRTGKMIVQNRELQKEIDQLRQDSKQLMLSVLKNPENDNLKRALITMQARINAQKHQIFQNRNMSAVKS